MKIIFGLILVFGVVNLSIAFSSLETTKGKPTLVEPLDTSGFFMDWDSMEFPDPLPSELELVYKNEKTIHYKGRDRALLYPPIIYLEDRIVTLDNDLMCLVVNNYFEARNRSDKKQNANTWTVINRVGKYGNETICDAVTNSFKDPKYNMQVEGLCHYSWYCDKRQILVMGDNSVELDAYFRVLANANKTLNDYYENQSKNDFTKGATHYHRDTVTPKWSLQMTQLFVVEDHLYYKGH